MGQRQGQNVRITTNNKNSHVVYTGACTMAISVRNKRFQCFLLFLLYQVVCEAHTTGEGEGERGWRVRRRLLEISPFLGTGTGTGTGTGISAEQSSW